MRHSFALSTAAVVCLAMSSGLFVVPLYAYIQQRSDSREKGRVVAANNFYQTIGMLIASAAMWLCYTRLHWSATAIMLAFGVSLLLVTAYIVTIVPDYLVRFVLWLLTHSLFRIRINGQENVPFTGPALLVANHMSHVDGLLIGASVQRFIRFMVWRPIYEMKALHWLLRRTNAIPVGAGGPRDMVESIRAARREIAAGHIVCIFAEGAISRTGNMLPFKRGMEKIVEGTDVPIIPVHLDRLWGSIFSFASGKFFWKWPTRIPYPVTVTFGAPMPPDSSAQAVRQAIQELSAEATAHRKRPADLLDRRLIHAARRNWSRFAMADTTGRSLTYGEVLTAAVMLGRTGPRPVPAEMVGVLLPSTVAGALVNVSLTLRGAVPVNLNFTAGPAAMQTAIDQCGIRTVISSRAFLAKAKLDPLPGTVYIEDLLKSVTPFAKLRAYLAARFAPAALLSPGRRTPDSLAAVIFSSGSTGVPKGVMLSHYNLIADIEAIAQLFWITPSDRIVGVLPFFHSFGFTVTIWFPLLSGCGVVYHPNPTDARAIGELVHQHKATLLLTTPTFCSTYTRKCSAEEFASLRYVLVGAEKLRQPVADAFREKFGVQLLEGYGCTEMSPVVAVNAPDFSAGKDTQTGSKAGTVGHPLPGVAARIVDPATFAPLPPNTEGLLAGERLQSNARLPQPARAHRRGLPRWLVRHRRHRPARRRRLPAHHRPPLPLQQNRRRNGAPPQGRGSHPRRPRRCPLRRHRHSRRHARRAPRSPLRAPHPHPGRPVPPDLRHRHAAPLDPQARKPLSRGSPPPTRHRQARPASRKDSSPGTSRRASLDASWGSSASPACRSVATPCPSVKWCN